MELVLFTTPRPFEGLFGMIQDNAWRSWYFLDPAPDKIVFFADEEHEGIEALTVARLVGEIEPVRQRSKNGVPIVTDMFSRAQEMADIACYVNADLLLENDLVPAIKIAASQFEECLIVARRWNVQILKPMGFGKGWEQRLRKKVEEQGSQSVDCLIDLFAWKGNVLEGLDPFVVGRYTWDNAIIARALKNNAPVVDISPVVRMTHQNHAIRAWADLDADYNRGFGALLCSLKDSTHTLMPDGGIVKGWKG